MIRDVVIVGAGQAAAQCIDTLKRKGFGGRITLVGDEPLLPYQRPPLSKKYLTGALARDRLLIRHESYYLEHGVRLRIGERVAFVDRDTHRVLLSNGDSLPYDALVLATGSRQRELRIPGSRLAHVHYLKNVADADQIRAVASPGARCVVVGGGYIGLETAASLREMGLDVTVLEMADRVMGRVVCPQVSAFYQARHAAQGVNVLLGARLESLVPHADGHRVRGARLADGREIPADVVVIGIGVLPQDALARECGLQCDNGVRVDEFCRSSDPTIYAIGDCANQLSLHYGQRVRLESVDNAFEQGITAALHIVGAPVPHDKVPWFWSDQYHHKLVIVGLNQGHDRLVIRGDERSGPFSACYLRAGELIAIDTVDNAKDHMAARKLIAARARPDPAKLANPAVPLKDC